MSTNTSRPRFTVVRSAAGVELFDVLENDRVVHKYLSRDEAAGLAAEMRKLHRKGQREAWQPRHTRPTPIIDPPPPTREQLMAMRMAGREADRKEASWSKQAKRRKGGSK